MIQFISVPCSPLVVMTQSAVLVAFACLSLTPCVEGVRQREEVEKYGGLDLGVGFRNVTDLFSTSDQGPRYAVLADGIKYMCCCNGESGASEISCILKDVEA